MNPLNLLTKGHTIKGFKSRSGVYKLPDRGFAPNFSSAKPAPPTTTHKEKAVSQPTFFDKPKPPVPAPPLKPSVAVPPPTPREPVWDRFVSGFRGFVERCTANGKASPFQRRTVQTELALEKVTVVRNDLADEDMEVISVRKKPVGRVTSRGVAKNEQCQVLSTDR
jgi:hypothetical protein